MFGELAEACSPLAMEEQVTEMLTASQSPTEQSALSSSEPAQ